MRVVTASQLPWKGTLLSVTSGSILCALLLHRRVDVVLDRLQKRLQRRLALRRARRAVTHGTLPPDVAQVRVTSCRREGMASNTSPLDHWVCGMEAQRNGSTWHILTAQDWTVT